MSIAFLRISQHTAIQSTAKWPHAKPLPSHLHSEVQGVQLFERRPTCIKLWNLLCHQQDFQAVLVTQRRISTSHWHVLVAPQSSETTS